VLPAVCAPIRQRAQHAVLLMDVDSDVVHENSSFRFPCSLRTEVLLSFYLTPDCRPCPTWVPIQEALALGVVSSRMRVPTVLRRRSD